MDAQGQEIKERGSLMKKDLIIWMPTAKGADTMKFENVTEFRGFETIIQFEYDGVSTSKHRRAAFERSKILGYALENEAGDDGN